MNIVYFCHCSCWLIINATEECENCFRYTHCEHFTGLLSRHNLINLLTHCSIFVMAAKWSIILTHRNVVNQLPSGEH